MNRRSFFGLGALLPFLAGKAEVEPLVGLDMGKTHDHSGIVMPGKKTECPKGKCIHCEFWGVGRLYRLMTGKCHYNPPTESGLNDSPSWPSVSNKDWCSKWTYAGRREVNRRLRYLSKISHMQKEETRKRELETKQ